MPRSRFTIVKGLKDLSKVHISMLWPLLFGRTISTLSDERVFERIELGESILRWGDGETANLRGKGTWHQDSSLALSKDLERLLDLDFSKRTIIFMIPTIAFKKSLFFYFRNDPQFLRVLFSTRVLFCQKRFKKILEGEICDASFWYRQFSRLSECLEKLEIRNREVLLVSSKKSKVLETMSKSFTFLELPSSNAYAVSESLRNAVYTWTENANQRPIIFLAGGAVGKLTFLLDLKGVQIIDIGSGLRFAEEGRVRMDWD